MPHLTKPKILSDENIPLKVDQYLKEKGFDVKKVPLGLSDKNILEIAKQERRVILTFDRHFINTRLFSLKDYEGIIFLNIHPPIIETIKISLDRLFEKVSEQELNGKLFILSSFGFRTRK